MATIVGTLVADTLLGGIDADTILGSSGDDSLSGSEGNDYIDGGVGFGDRLLGGIGDDTLLDTDGVATMDGGDGNDFLNVTFTATAPASSFFAITGGTGNDRIDISMNKSTFLIRLYADNAVVGKDGMDEVRLTGVYAGSEIFLGGGNDSFLGGTGLDTVYGDAGSDFIELSGGNDSATGGAGKDTLNGGSGDDTISGGLDNDILVGDSGLKDKIYGEAGNDTIEDEDGVYAANGAEGNDLITITFASNWDNDTITTNNPTADYIVAGGYGSDTVNVIMNNSKFILNLLGDQSVSDEKLDGKDIIKIDGIYLRSNIDLGGNSDKFTGSTYADSVLGGAGLDVIAGGGGNDSLYGGIDNDTLDGNLGFGDLLYGGDGNDKILDEDGVFAAHGEAGIDKIDVIFQSTWVNATNGSLSDKAISGGAGADNINVTMNKSAMLLTVYGDETVGGETTLDGGDKIYLKGLYSRATIEGGAGDDYLSGGYNIDVINGGTGKDKLFGNGGTDSLYGGVGDDMLDGGEGADILRGEAGIDSLRGGAGADIFYISNDAGADRLLDLEEADVINLSAFAMGITSANFVGWLDVAVSISGRTLTLTLDADTQLILSNTLKPTLDIGDFVF